MPAGALRHRVRFERLTIDLDSEGAQEEVWADAFGLVSAEIAPLSGRELLAAQGVHSKVSTRIRVRYRPGIDAIMRVVHRDASIYNIEAVVPDNDSGRRWITLLCSQGVNDG
jgi:SPP1 family predicted phage head-tail adaptor